MSELPGGRASAMTEATQQLHGVRVQDDGAAEAPPTRAAVEWVLLGELVGQSMEPLTWPERRSVRRAVRLGRAVDDVRLAPAAIAVAVQAQHAALTPVQRLTGKSAWFFLVGPLAFVGSIVIGWSLRSTAESVVFGGLVLVMLARQVRALVPHRRQAAHAAQAEALNRAALDRVPPTG